MKKLGWSLLGLYLLILLLRETLVFAKQNFGSISLAFFIIGGAWWASSNINKKANDAKKRTEDALSDKILQTSRKDYIHNFKIIKEIGWVNVKDCTSPQDIERALKIEAAQRGGNAITKLHWTTHKQTYVAGRGKKGNPYYQNKTVYDGEGYAVEIQKNMPAKTSIRQNLTNSEKLESVGYPSGWVALDGNNLFGKIHEQLKDVEHSFNVLRSFLLRLSHSPYKAHVFWDGKFVSFANALDPSSRDQNFEKWLQTKLSIQQENLTISSFDQRADVLLVPWAHAKSAAVISNDNFNKDYEDALIASKADSLKKSGRLLQFHFISGEIIVPEMTSL